MPGCELKRRKLELYVKKEFQDREEILEIEITYRPTDVEGNSIIEKRSTIKENIEVFNTLEYKKTEYSNTVVMTDSFHIDNEEILVITNRNDVLYFTLCNILTGETVSFTTNETEFTKKYKRRFHRISMNVLINEIIFE